MTDETGARIESGGILGAAPGRVAVMRLRVRNDATTPRAFLVSVVGLDSDWLPGVVRTPTLLPNAEVETELPLAPSAGTPPGAYALVVVVQPVDPVTGHAAGQVTQIESSLVVGDPAQLALEIEPTDPRATRTKRVLLHLTNRGTKPLSVDVSTTTATGLDFSLRRREVDLAAGATTSIRGRLTADRRRWFGQNRRMPFIITAQGETTPVRIDGVFVAHPVLNRTATRLIAVIAVLGVWAATALFAVTAISRHARNSQQTQISAISGQPSKGGAKGGGNGSGSGKNGAGSGAGNGKNGGTGGAAAAGGRLNGTVTGTAPGGVTVTLSDTSLTAPQPKQTSFVNVAYSPDSIGKLSSTVSDLAQARTASPVRRTTTAKDGSFAFAGLKSPGYYLVTLTKPGYQSRSYVISATPGKPLPNLQVAMTAGQGKLAGAVTGPGGSALPSGAHVTITGGPLELATNAQATGKSVGHWRVDGVSTPGDYVVSASADGYGTESQVVHLGASGSAFRHITLHPGVESIEGVISDRSNQPVGGATITATNGDLTRSATSLTTGSTGFYSIAALPIGSDYTVTVAALGFATQTFKVHLGGQKSAATQNATMTSSTATITGKVFDLKTNDPIDSAGLILAGDTGTYKIVSRAGTGEFTFDGVAPGDYTLTVEAFGYEADFRSVTVHAGDVTALDPIGLSIDPTGGIPSTSSITGHVVDAHTGAALQCPTTGGAGCQIHITVRPPQGEPELQPITVGADQPYKAPRPNETDPAYAHGLPPGLYTLKFQFPGYEPNTLAVAVPESTVVSAVPVALVPNGTMVGHITATTTKFTGCVIAVPFDPAHSGTAVPLPAGTNCATQPSAAALASGTVPCSVDPGVCIGQIDSNGEYEIKFVPHGTYWVYIRTEVLNDPAHAVDPQFVPLQPVELTVEAGQSRRYDAILNQFGEVKVLLQVAQPSGEPGTLGANHTVYLWNSDTNVMLPSKLTDGDGIADFPTVPSGTYVACAANPDVTSVVTSCPISGAPATTVTGATDPFQVSVNQVISVPLVLTKDNGAFIGQVYSLVDNAKHVLKGTTVQISGVTGYSGQVARHDTATATTDANGCFAMGPPGSTVLPTPECPTAPTLTPITFKTAPDSATIDSRSDPAFDRYGLQQLSGLTLLTDGSTNGLVVKAPTTPITSNVTVHPSVNGASPDKVSVLATQLAPGSGNITLSVNYTGTPTAGSDATGTLQWQDASLDSAARNNNEAVPGTYKVRASLDGYDDTTGEFDVPLIEDSASLVAYGGPNLTLDAHGALQFNAVDTSSGTDVPVEGATYTLSSSHIAPVTVAAEPDADSVTFPDLSKADGPYTATVRASGFDATQSVPVDVVPGVTTSTDVDLSQLGTMTGTASGDLGDGHSFPLAGAKVQATDGTDTFTTVTDVDGTYTLTGTTGKPGLKPGAWNVTFSAFGYVSDLHSGVTVVAGNNSLDDTLTAHTIDDVHVEVRDDTGALVVGAHVVLQNSQLATQPTPCDTNASGICSFTDVAPVTYAVIVTEAGYAPLSTSMTVRVGDHTTRQDFIFVIAQRGNTVSGTVSGRKLDGSVQTDFTGANLTVTLTNTSTSSTVPGTVTVTTGEFSFTGVPDGTYRLQASATGYQSFSQNVTLAGGQAAFINVTLNAPSFQLTVTVASSLGTSMLGYTVSLQSTTGGQDQNAQPVSVVSGKFGGKAFTTFNQVPQDTYDIVVTPPAGQIGTTLSAVDYTAATGSVENDVLINEALLHIRVSSQHSSGTPTPTAALTVKGPSPATTTVFSGTASGDSSTTDVFVPALDSGSEDYTVAADITGSSGTWTSLTASQTVSVTKTTTTTVTLSFTEVTTLTVTVTLDSDGSLVGGAGVTATKSGGGGTLTCTTSSTADATLGTCTLSGLDPTSKYTVSANKTTLNGSVHNVSVNPGANSVSVPIK